jgi:putative transposase
MPEQPISYRGCHFPGAVIAHAVWLYLRFPLSFRDVEEMLDERGIRVSYETVRRWVAKFGGLYTEELRRRESRRGRTLHLDEMALRVGGKQHWLWRAVDEHGTSLDVLLQEHRDTDAAERFFRRLLGDSGAPPERITTDKLGSYAAAIRRLPQLSKAEHQEVRATLRCNNRVEQAHQPTRIRERRMGRFRCHISAQRFLSSFARVSNLFRPGRHRLKAHEWRSTLRASFSTWQQVVGISVS